MIVMSFAFAFILISVILQLYNWKTRKRTRKRVQIDRVCFVIILRAIGIILSIFTLCTSYINIYTYATIMFAFAFLICDLWKVKELIDEIIK